MCTTAGGCKPPGSPVTAADAWRLQAIFNFRINCCDTLGCGDIHERDVAQKKQASKTNFTKVAYLKFRTGQYFLHTWHAYGRSQIPYTLIIVRTQPPDIPESAQYALPIFSRRLHLCPVAHRGRSYTHSKRHHTHSKRHAVTDC